MKRGISYRIGFAYKDPHTLYDLHCQDIHEDHEHEHKHLLTKYDPDVMGDYITQLIPCLEHGAKNNLDQRFLSDDPKIKWVN